MKVFLAHLVHETDASSSIPTTLRNYRENFLYLPSTGEGRELLGALSQRRSLITILRDRGHDVVIGLIAAAHPSRRTPKRDYNLLKHELIANLRAAMPVDAVVLSLHGAQLAEGVDDCETDVVRAVRQVVGAKVPIGVLLDLHGNLGPELLHQATLVVAGIEYPHTDIPERSEHLIDLLERTVAGTFRPAQALAPIPMIGIFFTTREPLQSMVAELVATQGRDGVVSTSFMHGFTSADIPRARASVIVISERGSDHANETARTIARKLFAVRDAIALKPLSIAEAVAEARRGSAAATGKPVIIAEVSDNPGGGGAGDATYLPSDLLKARFDRALFGMLCDPMAIDIIQRLDIGSTARLRIGGKAGRRSGQPLDVTATIVSHHPQLIQTAFGAREDLGPAAVIRVAGTDILITSRRQQVLSPSCFRSAGLEPEHYQVIGLKSMHHFYAEFSGLSPRILYASHEPNEVASGSNLSRPLWPLDSTPFEVDGEVWT